MIYLIGGPPRCGKTTLAKALSKKLNIPWISCDTLESISGEYMSQKQWNKTHPYSKLRKKEKSTDVFYANHSAQEIVSVLKKQALPAYAAIQMMALCEIENGNDYIIEGYHLLPSFVDKLIKKHGKKNFKAVFLTKFDAQKFAVDVHKSSTPNDWLLLSVKKKETFVKVGEMVSAYSGVFEKEAKKYRLQSLCMDVNFEKQVKASMLYFTKNEEPSKYLKKALKVSAEELKNGWVSPPFDNVKDSIAWLNDPKRKYVRDLQ